MEKGSRNNLIVEAESTVILSCKLVLLTQPGNYKNARLLKIFPFG